MGSRTASPRGSGPSPPVPEDVRMRRFIRRTARGGRRVGLTLAVALLAGLTSVAASIPSAPSASALSTSGYWLVATDGGIFSFGGAGFFGSTGAIKLAKRIQQMASTPSGRGYWMVAGDGGVFAFGDAAFYGSAADGKSEKRIVDIAASATGKGYYMTASNGAVYAFGDAKYYGGAEAQKLTHGIISMVAMNNGDPPVAGDDVLNVDEDGAATLDVLVNDHDSEGGPLTVESVSNPA